MTSNYVFKLEVEVPESSNPNPIITKAAALGRHITLGVLDEVPVSAEPKLRSIGALLHPACPSIATISEYMRVGAVFDLLALRIMHVEDAGVMYARETLVQLLRLAGLEGYLNNTYEYTPHITLGPLEEYMEYLLQPRLDQPRGSVFVRRLVLRSRSEHDDLEIWS